MSEDRGIADPSAAEVRTADEIIADVQRAMTPPDPPAPPQPPKETGPPILHDAW
jgi:hypothetical protein